MIRRIADQLIVEALEILDSDAMSHTDTQYERAFGLQRAGDLVLTDDPNKALISWTTLNLDWNEGRG